MADDAEIEARFWKELKSSPFLMLGLSDVDGGHSRPMATYFDDDHGPLWFFTSSDNALYRGVEAGEHTAIAHYFAKDHDLFATIHGSLSVDHSEATIDHFWNSHAAAWFEGGRDDPKLRLLRLDTREAQIWRDGSSIGATVLSLFGRDPKQDYQDNVAKVML